MKQDNLKLNYYGMKKEQVNNPTNIINRSNNEVNNCDSCNTYTADIRAKNSIITLLLIIVLIISCITPILINISRETGRHQREIEIRQSLKNEFDNKVEKEVSIRLKINEIRIKHEVESSFRDEFGGLYSNETIKGKVIPVQKSTKERITIKW